MTPARESSCSISFNNSRSVVSGCAQPQPRAAAAADGLADEDNYQEATTKTLPSRLAHSGILFWQ